MRLGPSVYDTDRKYITNHLVEVWEPWDLPHAYLASRVVDGVPTQATTNIEEWQRLTESVSSDRQLCVG